MPKLLMLVALVALLIGVLARQLCVARKRTVERLVEERTADLRREVLAAESRVARVTRRAEALDRMKSQHFVDISHEFRTPLTLTLGPLRDLEEGAFGSMGDEAARQVALARRSAEDVLRLVDQLLDIAKVEAGRLQLRVRRAELAAFLRGLAERFQPLAERRRLALDFRAPAPPIDLWFDPEQLERVFANLLSNAMKFTPPGGTVRLTLEPLATRPPPRNVSGAPDVATVHVADDGPGIEPGELPRIFDRFHQASPRRGADGTDSLGVRRHPGSGLGLSFARELVDLHRGSLTVASQPGQGCTFTVKLRLGREHFSADQLAQREAGAPPAGPGLVAAGAGTAPELPPSATRPGQAEDRKTVLVVDDHPAVRAYLRRHLEGRYRVTEARDGVEGLGRARQLLPDLVLSDVIMPEMDGHALCRALKHDPDLDDVPVILLTAKATSESRLEGLRGGADDYLTKPFEVHELVARIDNLITLRRCLRDRLGGRRRGARLTLPVAPRGRLSPADQRFLARVGQVIDEGLGDETFHVEALAERLVIDRSHLYRRLRQLTARSPSQLILEARLERGAELLAAGDASVNQAAYATGFKSAAHFSSRFKKRYKVSPSDYRTRKRQRNPPIRNVQT